MRVLSWNVRSLRDSRADVLAGLRAFDADVVCLQEVPRFLFGNLRWHRLVRAAGYEPVVGGRPGAVALASRLPTTDARHVRLSKTRGLHQRGAVLARVGGLTVVTTHLGLDADERLRHSRELLLPDGPVLLVGDLNEPPGRLFPGLVDVHRPPQDTFPAGRADVRIDVALTNVPWRRRCRAAEPSSGLFVRATDHLPLLVQL